MTKIAVTVAEATAMAGIGTTKIYEEFKAGRLTPRKSGRRTLVLVEELEAYIRALPIADCAKAA